MDSKELARSNSELFRSRGSSAGFFFLSFMFFGLVCESFFSSELKQVITTCAWATLAISSFYAIMHRPKIEIFDEGLEIINPISSHIIAWSEVRSIDTRFTLSVTTLDGSKIHAWAAPAPGRYHARRLHSSDLRALKMGIGGSIKAGESPQSDSGAANLLISRRFDEFKLRPLNPEHTGIKSVNRNWIPVILNLIAITVVVILH